MEIIAHRGFRGRYPEMTAQAYEKACELPIHGVECDVRLTADGHLACVHDRTLLRIASCGLVVSTATMDQLREHGVITLDELIDILPEDKHLYIETKHPMRYGVMAEEQVALRLRYRGLLHDPRFHLISFSHAAIRRMGRIAPGFDTIYLRREWELRYNPKDFAISRPSAWGLSLAHAKLWPQLIGRDGKKTYMWTVNDADDVRWARDNGVQLLATDYPDVALEALAQ